MNMLDITWMEGYEEQDEYISCVEDLVFHPLIQSMGGFRHHQKTSCLDHSLSVSYTSYLLCKALGWDYRSAARGGLMHDLFLYDYRTTTLEEGRHGVVHPRIALDNASAITDVNDVERDIILKHMYPRTWQRPSFKESFLVCLVDKYWAVKEFLGLSGLTRPKFRCRPLTQWLLLVLGAAIKI